MHGSLPCGASRPAAVRAKRTSGLRHAKRNDRLQLVRLEQVLRARLLSPGRDSLSTRAVWGENRSEEHTSELQSQSNLVCRLLLEKKKKIQTILHHSYLNYHLS